MEKSKKLLDSWHVTGKGITSFKEAVNEINERTEFVKVLPNSMTFIKNDGVYHAQTYDPDEGTLKVICCNKENAGKTATISNINADKNVDSKSIMNEFINKSALIMRMDKKTYFLSTEAFFTLKERIGMKDAIYNRFPERDIFISKLMENMNTAWIMCVRKDGVGKGTINKVYAIFTEKYQPIPQGIIMNVIEKILEISIFGRPVASSWKITQICTEIVIEFPDYAKEISDTYGIIDLIPCIRIMSGDTGKQSLTFHACWKRKSHYIVQDEVTIKHLTRLTCDKIYDKAVDNLFPKYAKYPELLVNTMSIIIHDGLNEKKGMETVEKFLKYVFKKIKLVEAIGKGNEKSIREILLSRFDYKKQISAYDIIASILDLPYMLRGISERYKLPLERACGLAPKIDVDSFLKEEKGDDLIMI